MRREERINDPEEAVRVALEGALAATWTALPGVVTDVDLEAQTVSVQPGVQGAVRGPGGAEELVDLPVLIHVPLVWPRAGGFAVTFPVAPGDEVLVVFACRAIDSWWQSGGVGAPVERRMHDLSDGFAVLAPTSQPKRLGGVAPDAVQVRSEDGSAFVEVRQDGRVRLVSPLRVEVEAPEVKVTAGTLAEVSAPAVKVDSQAIDLDGIGWATHVHGASPPPSGPPAVP